MKKVLAMFLMICLLLPIVSCVGGRGGDDPTSTTASDFSDGTTTPPDDVTTTEPIVDPPALPMEGYVYRGYYSGQPISVSANVDFMGCFDSYDPNRNSLSAAIYYRNQMIQAVYGCTIVERGRYLKSTYDEFSAFADNGEKFEVAIMGAKSTALLAADGLLRDLKVISEYTDGSIEDEIFDQNSVRDLSVGGRVYSVSGDMSISPIYNAPATVFNEKLFSDSRQRIVEELGEEYGDLYKMVEYGTWTREAMMSIANLVSHDHTEGDGVLSTKNGDTVGYFAYSASPVYHWFGEGMRFAKKIDGKITMDGVCNTVKARKTYNELFALFNQPAGSLIPRGDSSLRREEFNDGNVLFTDYVVCDIGHQLYRDNEAPYGILPIAKQSSGQEGYRSLVYFQSDHTGLWSIPVHCKNLPYAAELFYAMAEYSGGVGGYQGIKDAYFSQVVSKKTTNSEGSLKSLEIIWSSLVYDWGMLYDYEWGTLDRMLRGTVTAEESEFDSYTNDEVMEEILAKMEAELSKFKNQP